MQSSHPALRILPEPVPYGAGSQHPGCKAERHNSCACSLSLRGGANLAATSPTRSPARPPPAAARSSPRSPWGGGHQAAPPLSPAAHQLPDGHLAQIAEAQVQLVAVELILQAPRFAAASPRHGPAAGGAAGGAGPGGVAGRCGAGQRGAAGPGRATPLPAPRHPLPRPRPRSGTGRVPSALCRPGAPRSAPPLLLPGAAPLPPGCWEARRGAPRVPASPPHRHPAAAAASERPQQHIVKLSDPCLVPLGAVAWFSSWCP